MKKSRLKRKQTSRRSPRKRPRYSPPAPHNQTHNPVFYHFGCWNHGDCTDPGTNIAKVMSRLSMESPETILICGDNYYPTKTETVDGKKKKVLNLDNLNKGFGCLPPFSKIYMSLGNHELDFETEDPISHNQEIACPVLNREMAAVATIQSNRIEFHLFQTIQIKESTLIIMFDSTMYDESEHDGKTMDKFLQCYRQILPSSAPTIITIQDLWKYQSKCFNEVVVSNLSNQIKNIVFVAHHPFAGFRIKKNIMIMLKPFPQLAHVLLNFMDRVSATTTTQIHYTYLCADYHFYQENDIELGRHQMKEFIVGTGGAESDENPVFHQSGNIPLPFSDTVGWESNRISYKCTMNNHYAETYKNKKFLFGFLKGVVSDDITFQFIEAIPSTNIVGGTRRRRRRRRRKTKRRITTFF